MIFFPVALILHGIALVASGDLFRQAFGAPLIIGGVMWLFRMIRKMRRSL